MSLKTSAMGTALKYTLRYVKQNPEENLTKILNLAESLFPERYKENCGLQELISNQVEYTTSHYESVQ